MPRFTYFSTRQNESNGLRRNRSFCEIEDTNGVKTTYYKNKQLGAGVFGNVYLMMPLDGEPIVVKEFKIRYNEFKSTSSLETDRENVFSWASDAVHADFAVAQSEAYFNQQLHGFGFHYETAEELRVSNNRDLILSSYPHQYVAMKYIDGIVLQNIEIEDLQQFITICIAVLEALKKLPFVHLDIKADNVIVKNDGNIEFIDFSWSRNVGDEIGVRLISPYHAPEVQISQKEKAYQRVDIYSVGAMFARLAMDNNINKHFSVNDRKIFDEIISKMKRPAKSRINVDVAIKKFSVWLMLFEQDYLSEEFLRSVKDDFGAQHFMRAISHYANRIYTEYFDCNFAKAVTFITQFEHDEDIYKSFLLEMNSIYFKQREHRKEQYYTIFGKHSRSDKLSAAQKLHYLLNGDDEVQFSDKEWAALHDGDLKCIAQKVLQLCQYQRYDHEDAPRSNQKL